MMRRREFLKTLAIGTAGVIPLGAATLKTSRAWADATQRFLLSKNGCGRATGYAETNKIVTLDGKTHACWLDSEGEGFHVRIRTLDRSSGQWSETYTIGQAYDNHGGPALTVDSKGFLHAVYYPHHHPFRHRRSVRSNDASEWEAEESFGQRCTYPTLMCGPDDTLYLTCRESVQNPWVVNLYTKPPGQPWQGPVALLRAERTGYAHFQEALAWGPDHRTLHLSCRIYDGGQDRVVGYLRSPDFGKTWERDDGTRVELPATAQTVTVIADTEKTPGLRCGSIAVDSSGKPHVLFSSGSPPPSSAWIATPEESGTWQRRALQEEAAGLMPGGGLCMAGGLVVSPGGRMFAVLQMKRPVAGEESWGHRSNEIGWLESQDAGASFTARLVSQPDPECPHWLPNIERPTGHNDITVPGLIYTAGTAGEGNRDILSNEVYWVKTG